MKEITSALVRQPGKSFTHAISPNNQSKKINIMHAIKQHMLFIKYLKSRGLSVQTLAADEKLPDGCFVDDAAVIIDDLLILGFSGNPKRQGEAKEIYKALKKHFKKIIEIKYPAYLDGGDLLFIKNTLYIGLSKRTNKKAAVVLAKFFHKCKKTISIKTIPVIKKIHLKSSVNYIGNNVLIINSSEIDISYFTNFTMIDVKNKRPTNANCLLLGDTVLIAKGSSFLKNKLKKLHIAYKEVDISEFKKAGGGINGLALFY